VEAAAESALTIGPLARAAVDLPEEARSKIHAAVKAALQAYQTPAGVTPPAACWLVGATV
jgi:hypothetical protein